MSKALFLATSLALFANTAAADTVSNGDFTHWTFDSTGTATASREATGGNPDGRLNVTTISGPLVYGTAIFTSTATLNVLQGESFDFSVDVLAGPGSYGAGQAIQLLVEQNGAIYGNFLDTTGSHATWNTFSASGTFDQSAFSRLIGAGPITPDFSGGTLTRFGFAAGNESSGTLTQYYDNFSLTSPAIAPVPEPETYALLLAGLGLVGFAARRHKA